MNSRTIVRQLLDDIKVAEAIKTTIHDIELVAGKAVQWQTTDKVARALRKALKNPGQSVSTVATPKDYYQLIEELASLLTSKV